MRVNLKLLRVKHNLTQGEMADRLGVSRVTYCKVENGKTNGSGTFWLAVSREFPDCNINQIIKTKGADDEA